jgi:hypothetical protein
VTVPDQGQPLLAGFGAQPATDDRVGPRTRPGAGMVAEGLLAVPRPGALDGDPALLGRILDALRSI